MINFTKINAVFFKGTLFLISILFALTAQAEKSVDCKSSIVGTWKSSANSKLTISSSSPGNITGTFTRSNGDSAPVNGNYSVTSTNGNCPVSFIANWPKSGSFYASVTSYTGMYQSSTGKIRTVFLLVNPTQPGYSSVSVSTDFFTKVSK